MGSDLEARLVRVEQLLQQLLQQLDKLQATAGKLAQQVVALPPGPNS